MKVVAAVIGFFVTVGASGALAQQVIDVDGIQTSTQSIRLKPGFQQEIILRGKPTISSVFIGDPKVVGVTVTSDKRFVINALPPAENQAGLAPEIRSTNILVSDPEKNIIASVNVDVGFSDEGSHSVEIHKRLSNDKNDRIGIEKYICSSTKCELVYRDKPEGRVQIIQQDNKNTNIAK